MISGGHWLPQEIWLDIFSYISDDSKELGNYRLICRSLDPVVEKLMVKQVPLDDDKNAQKLYSYLTQKPWISQNIQSVDLNPYGIELTLFRETMLLLLTPHLRMLDGYRSTVSNLKNCLAQDSSPKHRDLLKSISIDFLQLKKVTKLRIYNNNIADDSMEQLEELLKGFVYLETLDWETMQNYHWEDPPNIHFKDWLLKEVSQVESLHTLTIQHNSYPCDPEALLYFSYKYPNIKMLEIQGEWSGRQPYYPVFEDVEAFHLKKLRIHCLGGIERLAEVWKRQSNSISIKYGGPDVHYTQGKCTLDIKKEKYLDHTVFDIEDAFYTIPPKAFVVFLSALGKSVITELEIDLAFFEEFADYKDTFPSDLLEAAPLMECLKMKANGLYLAKRTHFPRLHTVELTDMDISTEDMANLGLSSPSLQHFTLSSCCVREVLLSGLQHVRLIDLSSNQLVSLSIIGDAVSHSDRKAGIKRSNEEVHIHLSVGQSEHHFFAKHAYDDSCLQQPQQTYESVFSPAAITIKCKSLQRFKADINGVEFDVKFDDEGKIRKPDQ
ncbi:hypothetical protein MBANPS3_002241 [Mucor bainieri]